MNSEGGLPKAASIDLVGEAQPRLPYQAVLEARRCALERELAPILSIPRPLVWEVGAGHGHFLSAYARANPGHTCIGIDIAGDRIERALRKRDRARLANLHFIRAESGLFLKTLPAYVSFFRIFVLFPDPWPKLRHHKHRLLQPSFLAQLVGRMGEGSRLFFRTDFRPYFDETTQLLRETAPWQLIDEPWPFEHETVFQSRAAGHDSLVARVVAPST